VAVNRELHGAEADGAHLTISDPARPHASPLRPARAP